MKARRGAVEAKELIVIGVLALAAIVGFIAYNGHAKRMAAEERRAAEIAREKREQAEKEERARRLKEEEEFERKRREARLAKEREEEERDAAERERRRQAEENAARLKQQADEARKWKEGYIAAQAKFKTTFRFSKDVPSREKVGGVTEQRTFWCAFASYPNEKRIFELNAKPGGRPEVVALTSDAAPAPVGFAEFRERMKNECAVIVSDSGSAYLTGLDSPAGEAYAVPPKGQDFRIDEIHLQDIYPTIVALGLKYPDMKFKVRLKSNSGKTNIDMRQLAYGGVLERAKIEEVISSKIVADARKRVPAKSQVKKRKMKRTAKLYDGEYVKTGIDGVTLVPRVFKFIGTTEYKVRDYRARDEFKKKWEHLYSIAVKEEEEEQRMETENSAAAEAEKNEKARALEQADSLAENEQAIESALAECKLIIMPVEKQKMATPSRAGKNASRR